MIKGMKKTALAVALLASLGTVNAAEMKISTTLGEAEGGVRVDEQTTTSPKFDLFKLDALPISIYYPETVDPVNGDFTIDVKDIGVANVVGASDEETVFGSEFEFPVDLGDLFNLTTDWDLLIRWELDGEVNVLTETAEFSAGTFEFFINDNYGENQYQGLKVLEADINPDGFLTTSTNDDGESAQVEMQAAIDYSWMASYDFSPFVDGDDFLTRSEDTIRKIVEDFLWIEDPYGITYGDQSDPKQTNAYGPLLGNGCDPVIDDGCELWQFDANADFSRAYDIWEHQNMLDVDTDYLNLSLRYHENDLYNIKNPPTAGACQGLVDLVAAQTEGADSSFIYDGQFAETDECRTTRADFNLRAEVAMPEPASLAMFGLGILGLAGLSRRKKA